MWIDLTWCIHPQMVTWPGDSSPEVAPAARISRGDSCNTTTLRFPSHLGTHLDAPFHFIPEGKRLQEMNLEDLIGPALVVDVSGVPGTITRRDLEQHGIGGAQRVLLKTRSGGWMKQPSFRNDFSALAPDGAQFLVDSGVRLAGIDYLSIEPFGSPDHQTHEILLGHEVVVVEGLDMSGLCAGEVEFICLPLKILDGDGSPCRAVARPIGSNR